MNTRRNERNGGIRLNLGEQKAIEYLTNNEWNVTDVTSCEEYYGQDIDLFIYKHGQKHSIEVKWDSRIAETGNMFIETITDIDKNKDGWFNFCCADFIFYGDSCNELFYVFSFTDLQDYVKHHSMEQRKAPDMNSYGKVKKVSQGFLVPIDDFRNNYKVQVISLK